MKKRLGNRRFLGVWTAGILLFVGGCSFDGLWNRAQLGFAERLGAYTFDVLLGLLDLDSAGDLGLGQGSGGGGEQE